MLTHWTVFKTKIENYRSNKGTDVRDFRVYLLDALGDKRLDKLPVISLKQAEEDRYAAKLRPGTPITVDVEEIREIAGRLVFAGELKLEEGKSNGSQK